MEQLFQVKFSDFPIRSRDIARKSENFPNLNLEYLENGQCQEDDSCGLVQGFGGGLSRETKIFGKFLFQDGETKINPMKEKSQEAEILDLGVFEPEKKEYEIGFSKFDQKWSTACRGRNSKMVRMSRITYDMLFEVYCTQL